MYDANGELLFAVEAGRGTTARAALNMMVAAVNANTKKP